jgi:multidrug efflux pump subunit AcrA (membrane-fusion protein)
MSGFSAEDELRAGSAKKAPAKMVVAIVLLAIVAAAVGYVMWSRSQLPEPHALRVRAVAPKPAAVYRWFSGRGVVVEAEPRPLAFDGPGRLVELLPAGAEFGAGEILGRLQGSAAIETLLAHHRSRLAFHEQMRDSMRAAGNAIEARQAELKLADKQRLIAETSEALAKVTLRSNEPGEVVETLAKVGTQVRTGAPVARIKGRLLHGDFRFEADELDAAGKLAFCRVEVVGLGPHASNAEPRHPNDPVADAAPPGAQGAPRFVDCSAPSRAGGRLTVGLPSDVGLVPGQPLRLARGRLDAVFPIPAAAVAGDGDERTVWIAGRDGRAERRAVTVAGVDGDEVYVGSGLHVGDDVIVEAPAGLAPGAPIAQDQ